MLVKALLTPVNGGSGAAKNPSQIIDPLVTSINQKLSQLSTEIIEKRDSAITAARERIQRHFE